MTTSTRSGRSNGQWAIDGRAPLNHNEEFKAADNGLNVRERIETVYAREGFDSIPADDLHGRMRWWGLYTQRKQGIDGGRTASLGPDELSDRYFMLRVRLDAGAVTTDQLRVLAGISTDFARDTADISDRQNIQYHWIEIESVPEIWRRLEAAGMQTTEACGDTPRVILGSPVAGIAADEVIDPSPGDRRDRRRYIGDPELANLPRKFKSAITGHPSLDVVHEINDISLVGVVHPELGPGYDLWVGGGLSMAPRLAERLGAFVTADQAPEVWYGVIRHLPRLRLPPAAGQGAAEVPAGRVGPGAVPRGARDEYLGYRLADGPAPRRSPGSPATMSGSTTRRTGAATSGFAPTVGRVSGADRCRTSPTRSKPPVRTASGSPRTRSCWCSTSSPIGSTPWWPPLEPLGLTASPSPFRRSHHGLHRHRVLQARLRRHQGHRPRRPSTSWNAAATRWPSTCRSACTSTAARTPAPGSRWPTSA